jgi:hypothetical protein
LTGLLGGANHSMNQASYAPTWPEVTGLITRIPGRNRYGLNSGGLAFAIFDIKAHDRLLRPLLAAGQPPSFTVDTNGTTSPDITARCSR